MKSNFLFLGDSITDCSRLWLPEKCGLGNGYVSFLNEKIHQNIPDAHVSNKGFDGFTVPALLRALSQDTSYKNADFIAVLIGINDIGISANTGQNLKQQNFYGAYEQLLRKLTSDTAAQILCMGPFVFPHPQEFLLWIPEIRFAEECISMLSKQYSAAFLPLHDRLNSAGEKVGYHRLTEDGIHLTAYGHQLLADIVYPFCMA